MRYRRDIDGLRALAVVPVVVYHIAQSFIRGGYVGVDIFFVISGYLISSNILRQADENRFSLGRFYEHRIRRILPAYAVLLVFVAVVVLIKFWPTETQAFGRALTAAIASVTNIYFWATTGYFAVSAEELPLLHTWSLSVEEQFYVVFPLLVIACTKWARSGLGPIVLVLFCVSLALSVRGAYVSPTATFYLLPTRAWELLLGTILALKMVPAPRSGLQRNLATALGLVLIVVPMFLYAPGTVFPGLAAVPPCLGAALILQAGETGDTVVSRLLSLPPVVFVGLISYSLYLWHWPLLVFQKTDFILIASNSKTISRAAVLAASFVCATLSWALVERTTRNRRLVPTRPLLIGSGLGALGLAAAAALMIATNGLPGRFAPEAVAVASYMGFDDIPRFRTGQCFLGPTDDFTTFDQKECLPDKPTRPTYLLLGDSHAGALYFGLSKVLSNANILQVTGVNCAPLTTAQPEASVACPKLIDLALNRLPASRSIKRVWLAARWNRGALIRAPDWSSDWMADLLKTVRDFKQRGLDVTVIGPMPEYTSALPHILARSIQDDNPDLAQRLVSIDSFALDRMMKAFADRNLIDYVSLVSALCADNKCATYAERRVPLLFDQDHLTEEGSQKVAVAIADQLTHVQ